MAKAGGAAGAGTRAAATQAAGTAPAAASAAPESPADAAPTDAAPAVALPRRRNPHGEGSRLRQELIAAAAQQLAEAGDDGLSLRGVAREVGIAAPSVYLHFASKEALLQAVLAEHFQALKRSIQEAAARAVGPAAKLRAGCLAYCRFAEEQPGPYRVLFGTPPPLPASEPGQAKPGMDAFATLVDGIAEGMDAGVVPPGDPFVVATGVWTALHGVVSLRRAMTDFPWPPLAAQVDAILSGMARLAPAEPETTAAATPGAAG